MGKYRAHRTPLCGETLLEAQLVLANRSPARGTAPRRIVQRGHAPAKRELGRMRRRRRGIVRARKTRMNYLQNIREIRGGIGDKNPVLPFTFFRNRDKMNTDGCGTRRPPEALFRRRRLRPDVRITELRRPVGSRPLFACLRYPADSCLSIFKEDIKTWQEK